MREAYQCAMCGIYRNSANRIICENCSNFNAYQERGVKVSKIDWIAAHIDQYLNAAMYHPRAH